MHKSTLKYNIIDRTNYLITFFPYICYFNNRDRVSKANCFRGYFLN